MDGSMICILKLRFVNVLPVLLHRLDSDANHVQVSITSQGLPTWAETRQKCVASSGSQTSEALETVLCEL